MSQQLNLFNPVFLRQKKYFSSTTMVRGLGVVLLVFFALYAVQLWQLSQWETQLEETDAQFQAVQRQLTQFAAEGKRVPSKALEDEAETLADQVDTQEQVLRGLESNQLGSTQGFSPYLTAFARQTLPGVWLTGFTARGSDGPVSIRGRLTRQELLPTYLRMLSKEDALRGRGFNELRVSTREEKENKSGPDYVEFTLGTPLTEEKDTTDEGFGTMLINRARHAIAGGRS